jgi:thiamine phosphate synthase YjbQ (UPF0047 family)
VRLPHTGVRPQSTCGFGPALTVPIADGKLVLGTWQQIFHLECNVRGRERTIVVTVIGD